MGLSANTDGLCNFWGRLANVQVISILLSSGVSSKQKLKRNVGSLHEMDFSIGAKTLRIVLKVYGYTLRRSNYVICIFAFFSSQEGFTLYGYTLLLLEQTVFSKHRFGRAMSTKKANRKS